MSYEVVGAEALLGQKSSKKRIWKLYDMSDSNSPTNPVVWTFSQMAGDVVSHVDWAQWKEAYPKRPLRVRVYEGSIQIGSTTWMPPKEGAGGAADSLGEIGTMMIRGFMDPEKRGRFWSIAKPFYEDLKGLLDPEERARKERLGQLRAEEEWLNRETNPARQITAGTDD